MQNKLQLLVVLDEEEEKEDVQMILRKPHVQIVPMVEVLQQSHTKSIAEEEVEEVEEVEEEEILLDVVCRARP